MPVSKKLVKVTLTLPESLRSEPGVNTYRVLGGSLTTAKAFGDTSLVLLGGTADIRGDTRYFSATVASGNLEFLVSDAESVDLEASLVKRRSPASSPGMVHNTSGRFLTEEQWISHSPMR